MPSRFRWDDYVLDLDAYRLERGGVPVALEPKAFNLLAVMVQRPGHLFTKQEIFDLVWPGTAVTDHALTRIVAQIRRALGDEAREARFLETVPTRGYRWIHPVETVDAVEQGPSLRTGRERSSRTDDPHLPRRPSRVARPGDRAGRRGRRRAGLGASRRGARPRSGAGCGGHAVQWPVQLTTHAGLDLHPALSPQNDAIAYVSDRTGSFEIVVRALDGSATETPLTSDGGAERAAGMVARRPVHRVSLAAQRRHLDRAVARRDAEADRGRRLQACVVARRCAHRLSVRRARRCCAIRLRRAERVDDSADVGRRWSRRVTLTRSGNPTGGHAAPAWSPDGRYICFAVFDAGPSNGLWLLDRQSGAVRMLHRRDEVYESVFAPDGSSIYIAGGDALIMRLPFDAATGTVDGSVRRSCPCPECPACAGLSISRDGARLAFAGTRFEQSDLGAAGRVPTARRQESRER